MININNSIADLQRQLDELAQVATKSQMWEDQLNRLNREQYILDNAAEWFSIGQKYKKWREDRFLTKSEVAKSIGVAPSTLTKFEEGQPTILATNIQAGYDMLIELDKLKRNVMQTEQLLKSKDLELKAARLMEIANEIDELDKKAVGNDDYQKASKLYCESSNIQNQIAMRYMRLIEDYKNILNQAEEKCEGLTVLSQLLHCYLEEIGHIEKFNDYMNYELECAKAESIPN